MDYNLSANLKQMQFYVCPTCHNIVTSLCGVEVKCCGHVLEPLQAQVGTGEHEIQAERIENDLYVSLDHPMTKAHNISFIAYVYQDRMTMVKLYPESQPEARIPYRGHGKILVYCQVHGLFSLDIR